MAIENRLTISVACCTCNGARFLRPQLQSILNQSWPPDEIILCDDHSNDRTPEIIREMKFPQAYFNPKRLGVTKNFEQAISLSTGDIIFLADQDDVWHPDKITRLTECFDNPRIAMAFSNGSVVNEAGKPLEYSLWNSMWFTTTEQEQMRAGDTLPILLRHAVAAGATLAFRSSFKPLLLPFPDLPHCHDIWIALLLATAAQIYPLNENLIDYRLHGNNEVGLKKHNLLSQIRMARWQLHFGAFQYAAELHTSARDRLSAHGLLSTCAEKILNEKIIHSQIRHALPKNPLKKLRPILSELRANNYHRYSYGYKSVLQDLFLR